MLFTTDSDTTSLAVHTEGLGKRFGTRAALDGVDLEVPRACRATTPRRSPTSARS
jgi:hypothetical protein